MRLRVVSADCRKISADDDFSVGLHVERVDRLAGVWVKIVERTVGVETGETIARLTADVGKTPPG